MWPMLRMRPSCLVFVLMCCVQVWCVVFLCFVLGLPMLYSYVAFAAITSVGVIGLYISYLGTVICRGTDILIVWQHPFGILV